MMDALNIGALTGSLVALVLYHAYAYGSLCLRKASTLQLTRCASLRIKTKNNIRH
jgi:hypothetical protein